MCRDHTATSITLISNLEGLHFKVPTSISSCFGEHGHGTAEMLGISDLIPSIAATIAAGNAPWLRRFLPGCVCQSGAGAEGLTCVGHRGDLGSTGEGLDPVGKLEDWGKVLGSLMSNDDMGLSENGVYPQL